jgi:glycosyltransferase involved in cell wall biosynthesis
MSTHQIDEIIVVAREDDSNTIQVADSAGARVVTIDRPGLAAAMFQGARAATTELVAFTDDDAVITPDWAQRAVRAFENDSRLGALGGADRIHGDIGDRSAFASSRVGTVSRSGRVLGGHHTASGSVRDVDHVKGVNCVFRRLPLIELVHEDAVVGSGAQSRNEFLLSLGVQHAGFKVRYDPELTVDHFPAPRATGDERGVSASKAYEAAHNEHLAFRLYRPALANRNAAWLRAVGYAHAPGLLRVLLGRADKASVRAVWSAVRNASLSGKSRAKHARWHHDYGGEP